MPVSLVTTTVNLHTDSCMITMYPTVRCDADGNAASEYILVNGFQHNAMQHNPPPFHVHLICSWGFSPSVRLKNYSTSQTKPTMNQSESKELTAVSNKLMPLFTIRSKSSWSSGSMDSSYPHRNWLPQDHVPTKTKGTCSH